METVAESAAAAASPPAQSAPVSDDADTIVVTGQGAPPGDPAAAINEVSFEAVQAVDRAIVGPSPMDM